MNRIIFDIPFTGTIIQTPFFLSKGEAVTAWNTRAERTCRNIAAPDRYFETFECSECGCTVDYQYMEVVSAKCPIRCFEYCPGCGARVVME